MTREYLEDTLLYVQLELTGMSKLGYKKEQLVDWAQKNVQTNVLNIICDDIQGMDLEEILKYLNDWKEEIK